MYLLAVGWYKWPEGYETNQFPSGVLKIWESSKGPFLSAHHKKRELSLLFSDNRNTCLILAASLLMSFIGGSPPPPLYMAHQADGG